MKVNLKSVNALMRAYDEGYEQGRDEAIKEYKQSDEYIKECVQRYLKGRADERKKIFDILKTFTKGDYNSRECKLMVSELIMWEGEQKNG